VVFNLLLQGIAAKHDQYVEDGSEHVQKHVDYLDVEDQAEQLCNEAALGVVSAEDGVGFRVEEGGQDAEWVAVAHGYSGPDDVREGAVSLEPEGHTWHLAHLPVDVQAQLSALFGVGHQAADWSEVNDSKQIDNHAGQDVSDIQFLEKEYDEK